MTEKKLAASREHDLTGQKRFARNVGASYLGQFAFIIFGFILPRVIDEKIGQTSLGIWDFGWSLVSYLSLSMIGIGSSVNRYVARLRSEGSLDELNRIISTVNAIQLAIASFVFVASVVLAYVVPIALAEKFENSSESVGLVIFLLGASLSVQMAYDAWRGVISGCHRWDYYHAVNSIGYTITSLAMILSLALGGGLGELATIYFVSTVGTELVRKRVALRVFPELKISLAQVNRPDAEKIVRFGIHSIMLGLPNIIVVQTVSILTVGQMGFAALALLVRPMAIVRQVGQLVNKYTFVLAPMAGALQGAGDSGDVRRFAIESSKAAYRVALPPLAFLFFLGDKVIQIWMGQNYAEWRVVAVLSASYMLIVPQRALVQIVIGLGKHHQLARRALAMSLLLLAISVLVASFFEWTVFSAALIISVSLGGSVGLFTPVACLRELDIRILSYVRNLIVEVLGLFTALSVGLVLIRVFLGSSAGVSIIAGLAYVGIVVLIFYWRLILQIIRDMRS